MRATAILNADGGTVLSTGAASMRDRIEAAFADRRVDAEIVLARGREIGTAAKQALDRAKRGEIDAVVAGGGDGTIGAIAGLAVGSGVPLGILPLGTLNHFARTLSVPADLDEAVGAIAGGATRAVDVAEVN